MVVGKRSRLGFGLIVWAVACGRVTKDEHGAGGGAAGARLVPDSGAGGAAGRREPGEAGKGVGAAPDDEDDSASLPPGTFELSEYSASDLDFLEVTSDAAGRALVVWGRGTLIHSARWDPVEASWTALPEFLAENAFAVASPDGGGALVAGTAASTQDPELLEVWARRFDLDSGVWSEPSSLPGTSWQTDWQVVLDAAGTAHASWRHPDGDSWSFWRAGSPGWEPAVAVEEESLLVAGGASTYLWSGNDALQVRTFDAASDSWSEATVLRDLTQQSGVSSHRLVTGRDDAALMISSRGASGEIVVEAWRKESAEEPWGAAQTVMVIPVDTDPASSIGPIGGVADPAGDYVWVPHERGDGSFDLSVARYDPAKSEWIASRVFHGPSGPELLDLATDESGRAYGFSYAAGLVRFDPETQAWSDAQSSGAHHVLGADRGAFAFGWNADGLIAFESEAGGEWRLATGQPATAALFQSDVDLAATLVGPERLLLVWGTTEGLRAIFIE